MPTTLRLIVLIGEVIGFLAFSIIRCIIHYKNYKGEKEKKGEFKSYAIFYAIFNSILILSSVFSFPGLKFLSYNKIIITSSIFILLIILVIGFIIFEKNEKKNNLSEKTGVCMVLIGFALSIACIFSGSVSSICSLSNTGVGIIFPFKTCIEEKEVIDKVYPILSLDNKYKIGYTINNVGEKDGYIFIYQDDSNNWYQVNEFLENTEELPTNESSYVVINQVTRTFINQELNENDEEYITEEKVIQYKLYYNPNELIEMQND